MESDIPDVSCHLIFQLSLECLPLEQGRDKKVYRKAANRGCAGVENWP